MLPIHLPKLVLQNCIPPVLLKSPLLFGIQKCGKRRLENI